MLTVSADLPVIGAVAIVFEAEEMRGRFTELLSGTFVNAFRLSAAGSYGINRFITEQRTVEVVEKAGGTYSEGWTSLSNLFVCFVDCDD